MTQAPRLVADVMARLAAEVRRAESQLSADRHSSGGADDRPKECCSPVAAWVLRQLVIRVSRPGRTSRACPGLMHEPPTCFDAGRWTEAAAPIELLLSSSEFHAAADRWREWMAAGEDFCPGAYLAEPFLAAYDGDERKRSGAYYTPWPIVDYLARSVDILLRRELGIGDGLAAMRRREEGVPAVIDPACGTGLFLGRVLELIHQPLSAAPTAVPAGRWSATDSFAVTRLRGLDISSAALEVASVILAPYLARSIHGQQVLRRQSALIPASDAVVDEARSRDGPLVVVGNPPYAGFGGANRDPWMLERMQRYRQGMGERKHGLHDDSLKFLCWSQYQIERAGRGVVALIINHAFLDGLTHPALRRSLLETFDQLYFYDLHGSLWRPGRTGEEGERDENVFGIRCGVTLCLLARSGASRGAGKVMYAELRGRRRTKLSRLAVEDVTRTRWTPVPISDESVGDPRSPLSFIAREIPVTLGATRPTSKTTSIAYGRWPGIDQIFARHVSGIQTKRDAWFTDLDREALAERIRHGITTEGSEPGASTGEFDPAKLRRYMTAPFDLRWIYYEPSLLGRARYEVMRHLLRPNLALVFMRQSTNVGEYDHFLVTPHLVSDRVFHSGHGAAYVAPLYLHDGSTPRGNLRDDYARELERRLGLSYSDSPAATENQYEPRQVLAFLYAVGWMPAYRRRFAAELPRGFPRLPWPADAAGFRRLADVGERLVALHAGPPGAGDAADSGTRGEEGDEWKEWNELEEWEVARGFPRFVADPNARDSSSTDDRGVIQVSAARSLGRISRRVWQQRVGGVAVLHRWLKQRRGRRLHDDDPRYFRELVQVLETTTRLRRELDSLAAETLDIRDH